VPATPVSATLASPVTVRLRLFPNADLWQPVPRPVPLVQQGLVRPKYLQPQVLRPQPVILASQAKFTLF
jgi:hypothetical protein